MSKAVKYTALLIAVVETVEFFAKRIETISNESTEKQPEND